MTGSKLIWSLMLGSALMIGCDDNTETPSGADATNPQATEEAADAMADTTENASERAKDLAGEAGGTLQEQAETASDTLKDTADEAAEAANANPAVADATAKVKTVMEKITAKDLSGAENLLKQLEANKASLPQAVQTQIDNARKMLDAAKTGAAAEPQTAPAAQ